MPEREAEELLPTELELTNIVESEERADLHRAYISNIERGSRNLSLENIEKVAKAFEIFVSDLFANYGIEAEE